MTINYQTENSTVDVDESIRRLRKGSHVFHTYRKVQLAVPSAVYEDIEVGDIVGKGAFSDVRSLRKFLRREPSESDSSESDCTDKSSVTSLTENGSFCMKQLRPDLPQVLRTNGAIDLAKEAEFLSALSHPNIVSFHSTSGNPGSKDFFIVIERLEKSLDDKMTEWSNELTNAQMNMSKSDYKVEINTLMDARLGVMLDVTSALEYLHEKSILFRDLKPANIGLDHQGGAKIFDFGIAKELKENDKVGKDQYLVSKMCGTQRYSAPEVYYAEPYGLPADVYSLSVLFWEVVTLEAPYSGMDKQEHEKHAYKKKRRPKIPRSWMKDMKKWVESGWAHEPQDRLTISEFSSNIRSILA